MGIFFAHGRENGAEKRKKKKWIWDEAERFKAIQRKNSDMADKEAISLFLFEYWKLLL